eukprot:gene16442-19443_t
MADQAGAVGGALAPGHEPGGLVVHQGGALAHRHQVLEHIE